jgi:hypothetical protein
VQVKAAQVGDGRQRPDWGIFVTGDDIPQRIHWRIRKLYVLPIDTCMSDPMELFIEEVGDDEDCLVEKSQRKTITSQSDYLFQIPENPILTEFQDYLINPRIWWIAEC